MTIQEVRPNLIVAFIRNFKHTIISLINKFFRNFGYVKIETDSNSYQQAKRELKLAFGDWEQGHPEIDEMQELMCKQILEIVGLFSNHGHSGFSASYAIPIIEKLLKHEILTPLTGEYDEWFNCYDEVYQNKRASNVFKDGDGYYQVDGIVFVEPSGAAFTSMGSKVTIKSFPYEPKKTYVNVDEEGNPIAEEEFEDLLFEWLKNANINLDIASPTLKGILDLYEHKKKV